MNEDVRPRGQPLPIKVVLLFSGGLDSSTLAYHMADEGRTLHLLSIYYGQRHAREIEAAREIAHGLPGQGHRFLPLNLFLQDCFTGSALTDNPSALPLDKHWEAPEQKATVVKGRNAVLLTVAAAYAASHDINVVALGCHAGDVAVYDDCRYTFTQHMQEALQVGGLYGMQIWAPMWDWSRKDVVRRARELKVPIEKTWSCYMGGKNPCRRCGACLERKAALEE